jgi:hypothetical protein
MFVCLFFFDLVSLSLLNIMMQLSGQFEKKNIETVFPSWQENVVYLDYIYE